MAVQRIHKGCQPARGERKRIVGRMLPADAEVIEQIAFRSGMSTSDYVALVLYRTFEMELPAWLPDRPDVVFDQESVTDARLDIAVFDDAFGKAS